MTSRLRLALLALLLCPLPAGAATLIERDIKFYWGDPAKHLIGGAVSTLAVSEFLKWRGYAPWKATTASILLGAAAATIKEFGHDRDPSANDLFWSGAGIALGTGVQITFRF